MMKKLVFMLGLVMHFSFLFSSENKPVVTQIKEVIVFQKGAQVYKSGTVFIDQGVTDLQISDLPRNINPQSLQVKGLGGFTILSVNYQLNYLKSQKDSKQIKTLKDSLEILMFKKKDTENKIEIYKAEEGILLANKSIGGDQSGVSITTLKEAMNYFHSKLLEIKSKELDLNTNLSALKESMNRIQNQLNILHSKQDNPTSEVVVKVLAKERTKAVLDLKYVVYNAGWIPEYDLRAVDITKPVQLNYKAKVFQSSGEDWANVKLTISTGNPQISGVKPEIYPWYVRFYEPVTLRGYAQPMAKKTQAVSEVMEMDEIIMNEAENVSFDAITNQTNVEFKIDIPYSIPSDGKAYAVQINEFNIAAHYTYYTAPKLNESAFLLAQITGWEQYNLLAGSANIFFEGTYVGNSTLDPQHANDTLNLSLGIDESIQVARTKIKDFESKRFIGVNKKEMYGYEIEIRNSKHSDISIVVEDQFPISTNKDIEVEQLEKSGAKFNELNGKLTWEIELKSLETKKLDMKYSIKYPKDKKINL